MTDTTSGTQTTQSTGPLTTDIVLQAYKAIADKRTAEQTGNCSRTTLDLTPGGLADAILGPAIFVAISAAVITYLVMERKSRVSIRNRNDWKPPRATSKRTRSVKSGETNGRYGWESHLPSPADDKTLSDKVQNLKDQIDDHVEAFYSDEADTRVSPGIDEALRGIEGRCTDLELSLCNTISKVRYPTNLIRQSLAGLCLLRPAYLLPPAMGGLLQAIGECSGHGEGIPAFYLALSRWRELCAYLHPDVSRTPQSSAARQANIDAAAHLFANAFSPWISGRYTEKERKQHLAAVLEEAAELQLLIFSQPGAIFWQWTSSAKVIGTVVYPGLDRGSFDERGEIQTRQVLVHPEVASFD